MLQRSSLPTTSPAEIADSLGRSLERSWERPFSGRALDGVLDGGLLDGGILDDRRWQALQDALPLPTTWQHYLLACLAIGIVAGGMCLQVLLSIQIADRELALRRLQSDYARVERQNSELIYAIAQQSSLDQMARLAAQSGYVPATSRTYVLHHAGATSLAGALMDAPAGAPAEAQTNRLPQPAVARPGAAAPAPETPNPTWLDQARQSWQELQRFVTTASGQLWRDFTGRME